MSKANKARDVAPAGFTVDRTLEPGRHGLAEVFPGLQGFPAFAALGKLDPGGLEPLRKVEIEVVEDDIWMYVAPHARPKNAPRQWNPVVAGEHDVIVVGQGHLKESPELLLYLDILHELCHITQRHRGMELWDRSYEYVDRPTEVEAYEFAVREARRLGVSEPYLREYLKVEWVSDKDHLRLIERMGLSQS